MTPNEILALRLTNQQLTRTRFADAQALVAWFGAVQSQDYASAKWALGLRLAGATDADVDTAFDRGEIVRTHVMRPTWHFVAPADIRWMLALTAPRVKRVMASYDRKLGLDEPLYARSNAAIASALEGGKHLTRAELQAALEAAGISVSGQALGHIVLRAELDAVTCSGPRRGKQFTYALLEERVPPGQALTTDEALAGLARRYFQSHGPATVPDLVWWSGLTVGQARQAVELLGGEVQRLDVLEKTYWLIGSSALPMPRRAYLLPNYDEYGIAYKERELFHDRTLIPAIAPAEQIPFNHMIVIGGRIVGMWRRTEVKGAVQVRLNPTTPLGNADLGRVKAALARYAKFLGTTVSLTE